MVDFLERNWLRSLHSLSVGLLAAVDAQGAPNLRGGGWRCHRRLTASLPFCCDRAAWALLSSGILASNCLAGNAEGSGDCRALAAIVAEAEGAGGSYHVSVSATGAVARSWREISISGTKLELSDVDDGFVEVPLPFSFPFFDRSFDRVFVGSNGVISFDAGCDLAVPFGFPCSAAPVYLIAVFWFDLYPGSGANGGDYGGGAAEPSAVYLKDGGDHVVIQYSADAQFYGTVPVPAVGLGRGVSTYYQEGFYIFQVVLYRSGAIDFVYRRMEGATSTAVVGLQGPDGAVLRIENSSLFASSGEAVALRIEKMTPTPRE